MKNDIKKDSGGEKSPLLLHNWISLAGMVLTGSSFFAVICLIALDFFRGFRNPYLGILTYLIAPTFLITGLLFIAAGALRERHRRRRQRPEQVPQLPRIDLNIPRQRHAFFVVLAATFVFLVLTSVGSYRAYEFTESVMFCGRTCHGTMKPEYTAYQESPHARVKCVQCHIGPGATWYVKSKLSGAYQVYATLVDKYPKPIPVPIENLRPVRETCEECHWPQKFFGAAEKTFHHFLPDEKNSTWTIQMLLKIGGGDPAFGDVGGIHWQMLIANKIEYIARDDGRQEIPWVRLTDSSGKVTVYESTDNPLKPEQIAAAKPRQIDCVDCHNRPTHIFHSPVDSVDLALETGRIDPAIPRIKEQTVGALTGDYATTDEAMQGIKKKLTSFYSTKYPEFIKANARRISQAVSETQDIYRKNFFPAMQVNWRFYPDNIGHWDFPGCYRCHDGRHKSDDGKTISHACDACHTIVAQGPPDKLQSSLNGLSFKHPEDIGTMWQQMRCSGCHDGALAE